MENTHYNIENVTRILPDNERMDTEIKTQYSSYVLIDEIFIESVIKEESEESFATESPQTEPEFVDIKIENNEAMEDPFCGASHTCSKDANCLKKHLKRNPGCKQLYISNLIVDDSRPQHEKYTKTVWQQSDGTTDGEYSTTQNQYGKRTYDKASSSSVLESIKSVVTVNNIPSLLDNQHSCHICSLSFMEKSKLVRHIQIHTEEKPFVCDVCKDTFNKKLSLTIHKRKHAAEKLFLCDVCNESFTQISSLNVHKRKHFIRKPFSCDICSKSFTDKRCLIRHTRTHTGEKPFSCDLCNKSFTQTWNLLIHKRRHTGEKPYICDVCNKSFTQISNLNVHKRKHTGEKPFFCNMCSQSFSQISNLNIHKRKHADKLLLI